MQGKREEGREHVSTVARCVVVLAFAFSFPSISSLFLLFPLPSSLALPSSLFPLPLSQGVRGSQITYELTPLVDRTPRLLQVHMIVPVKDPAAAIVVQMPVWSPGDYHVQNHARYVQDFQAWDVSAGPNGSPALKVGHPDANTWEITPAGAKAVVISYALPETPPGIFSENIQLRARLAFANGPAVYLYLVGHKEWPALLNVRLPPDWRVETPLAPGPQEPGGGVSFQAPDYDTLADSPVVMGANGAITVREFTYKGVSHRAVFFGAQDRLRAVDDFVPVLQKIVKAESALMGGELPYSRYDFLFDVDGRGGGLEHLNACRIALGEEETPLFAVSFCAHEFFHLWNVKRIRPRVLGPFDYIHPPHTRNLWFAEGVTEYYAHLAALRAGLTAPDGFLQHYRSAWRRMERNPARLKVTADEASLRVWDSGSSQGFGGLSYYDKGELIGLCLDLKIRRETGNRRSLDDVMRLLMQRHNPPKPGYDEEELRATVSEVAGKDLSAFYDVLARSTQEMPLAECLAYAGLDAALQPLLNATPEQDALRKSWLATVP
jgi:predicted metalloprotease with PDZ domain